ncbi:MAG: DinB family protein [Cryomorphaceae bacterium]|nr:DinB family protein [Cryomorphaceae bacterium]
MKAKLLMFTLLITTSIMAQQYNQQQTVAQYVQYTVWANEQLIQWLETCDKDVWTKELSSSFNSIAATSRHLWNAEFGWLTTLKKKPWDNVPDGMSKDGILNGWRQTSQDFASYALNLLEEEKEGVRLLGDDEVRIEDILLHVCNHATYHRGQLITLGRQVGLSKPPRTDYIYYIRSVRNQ